MRPNRSSLTSTYIINTASVRYGTIWHGMVWYQYHAATIPQMATDAHCIHNIMENRKESSSCNSRERTMKRKTKLPIVAVVLGIVIIFERYAALRSWREYTGILGKPEPLKIGVASFDSWPPQADFNCGYVGFADNFVAALERLNVTNYILVPLDPSAYTLLREMYPAHTWDNPDFDVCTGMLYLEPHPQNLALVHEWKKELETEKHLEDQFAFNAALPRIRNSMNFIHRNNSHAQFPPGYKARWSSTSSRDLSILVMHNNYIAGKDKKFQRFRQARLWRPSGKLDRERFESLCFE
eukprot:scaffold9946_cov188-Amphora_coffeaeformis.AAC.1